jgi:hypothetical protein
MSRSRPFPDAGFVAGIYRRMDTDPGEGTSYSFTWLFAISVAWGLLLCLMILNILVRRGCCSCVQRRLEHREQQRRNRMIRQNLTVRQWKDGKVEPFTSSQDEISCTFQDDPTVLAEKGAHHTDSETGSVESAQQSSQNSLSTDSLPSQDEENAAECPICLVPYQNHDRVCVANNMACQHVFHETCIMHWLLLMHDECPVCRSSFLQQTV